MRYNKHRGKNYDISNMCKNIELCQAVKIVIITFLITGLPVQLFNIFRDNIVAFHPMLYTSSLV